MNAHGKVIKRVQVGRGEGDGVIRVLDAHLGANGGLNRPLGNSAHVLIDRSGKEAK